MICSDPQDGTVLPSKRTFYGPQTLIKALSVLDCFSLQQPVLTAAQISQRLNLSTSALYRYLSAMEDEGYLMRDESSGRYCIGLRVIELAGISLSRFEIIRHGQHELDEMADHLNMNANMAILHEGDTFHLAFSMREERVKTYAIIGRRSPAHCTALGKSMLAQLPLEQVHALIEKYGWRTRTEYSISDFERLDAELERVRANGYATDMREVNPASCCAAAPVFQQGGVLAGAISVSTSYERFQKEREQMIHEAVVHAERLSVKLGYLPSRL